MIPWIIVAVVLVPLVVIAFVVTRRNTAAGELASAGDDDVARERTASEYRALVEEAGFEFGDVIRLDAPRDLIVARKK